MERNASTVSSSTINQAYQALRCPVDRAKYLVRNYSLQIIDFQLQIINLIHFMFFIYCSYLWKVLLH